jgi:hypothetical protein
VVFLGIKCRPSKTPTGKSWLPAFGLGDNGLAWSSGSFQNHKVLEASNLNNAK